MLGRFVVGRRFVDKEVCARTRHCQGGNRAHGCRELASASVRHGSLLYLTMCLCRRPRRSFWQEPHTVDGTSEGSVTRVVILNREAIATRTVIADPRTAVDNTAGPLWPRQMG